MVKNICNWFGWITDGIYSKAPTSKRVCVDVTGTADRSV
jgi:hypothetical protein